MPMGRTGQQNRFKQNAGQAMHKVDSNRTHRTPSSLLVSSSKLSKADRRLFRSLKRNPVTRQLSLRLAGATR